MIAIVNIVVPLFSNQYESNIKGIVIDSESGDKISQANVVAVGTEFGTSTNKYGEFIVDYHIEYPITLEISHIGYRTHIEVIEKPERDSINIILYKQSIEMEKLVVTGTRSKKLHNDTPIATEVINRREIENSGTRNMAELLSQRAGVSLQTSVEGGSVLNILGMDSRYILILINGQPITGRFNNRVSLDQILIDNIKRVEIVKGPNSSLYGSEAMGGVINIITNNNLNSQEINVSTRYSNTESNIRNVGLKNGSNNFSINVIQPLSDIKIDLIINVDEIQNDKSVLEIETDKVRKTSIGANIDWNLNDFHKINFGSNTYGQLDRGSTKLMNTNTDINRKNLSISHSGKNQKGWDLHQKITSSNYSRNYVQKRPSGNIEKDDLTTENYNEYEILLNKKDESNELNVGFEIYRANYSSDRISSGKQEITNRSLFGQYDFHLIKQLNIICGIRFDDFVEYENVLSPRIGLMYKFSKHWKFRTSWGKGFRAPSFMERYIDWNHIQFNYVVLGNPDLKPERSNGITLGIDYLSSSQNQLSLMFYHTQFENLIQDYAIKPGLLSYQNINEATFEGIELQQMVNISERWKTKWGFNWLNNRDGENKMIPNTIPFSISNVWNYNNPNNGINTSINSKWVAPYEPQEYDPEKGVYVLSDNKIGGYALINWRTTVQINKSLIFSFGINNLANYTNKDFGPFIGRVAYLEFSNKIKRG